MKKYAQPIAEITLFSVEDIITVSAVVSGTNGVIVNSGSLSGEEKNMYDIYSKNSAAKNTDVSIFTW